MSILSSSAQNQDPTMISSFSAPCLDSKLAPALRLVSSTAQNQDSTMTSSSPAFGLYLLQILASFLMASSLAQNQDPTKSSSAASLSSSLASASVLSLSSSLAQNQESIVFLFHIQPGFFSVCSLYNGFIPFPEPGCDHGLLFGRWLGFFFSPIICTAFFHSP